MTLTTAARRFDVGLSSNQRGAAQAVERSLIIRGGPGSGRTHTLMGRVHHLLSQGEPPRYMHVWLAHPHAARDFRRRFADTAVNPAAPPQIFIGTVHSAAYLYLDLRGESVIRRAPNFKIWNRERAAAEIGRLARRVLPQVKEKEQEVAQILSWYITNANRYRQGPPLIAQRGEWHEIVALYEATKRGMDAFDLDDLVSKAVMVLEADTNRERVVQVMCRNALVDDFQEMTPVQYRFSIS